MGHSLIGQLHLHAMPVLKTTVSVTPILDPVLTGQSMTMSVLKTTVSVTSTLGSLLTGQSMTMSVLKTTVSVTSTLGSVLTVLTDHVCIENNSKRLTLGQ